MSRRSPPYATAEAALLGAVLPAGLFYVISHANVATGADGGPFVAAWVIAVAVGTAALGAVRNHSTGSLLWGALGGSIVGFSAFALLVGWGIAAFALPLLGGLALAAGAWANHELRRRQGVESEPARGTWRSRFVAVVAASLAGMGLLVVI